MHIELVDTRFKLLCDEFTLESKITQNNENIAFGYSSDRIFWFVLGHNIVHVASNIIT